ncbi:HAMP domain-containing sensor histidine kinase [Microbacterium sp. NPDC019599]|uniref:HAMP domain-containing sensor histidine kinase n=1 Tax=Microbacterium sp. NPDC019599 TaxID=3154690 RepID=UPI0033E634AD
MSSSTASARAGGVQRTRERALLLNQLMFGGVVLLAIILIIGTDVIQNVTAFAAATLLIFVATGAAIIAPWDRLPFLVGMLLPVTDAVVITLLIAASPDTGLEILWVFPAMWLGAALGLIGVGVATLLATVGYWTVIGLDPSRPFTASVVIVPITVAAVATASHLSARRDGAHRLLLERHSKQLRQSVERARHQEDLITDVLDAVDFGVARLRVDGSLVVTNEANARMPQRSSDVVRAFAADGLTALEPRDLPLARARQGEFFEDELVWYGRPGDDRRRAVRTTARPVFDTDLQHDGAIVVSRDVTAEELALRAREDLVASVSHELRTPLTSITGYLDLALDHSDLPQSARRSLEIVQRNVERLLELVSDILATSTASRRGVELTIHRERTDLAPVVQAAIEAATPRAAEREISIDGSGIEETIVHADAGRIRQVVDNLISNAIKYGRDGGRVEIGTTHDRDHAWIVVRDDGRGISQEELPRLFERFFRSDAVRKTTTHGSGLGLAISRDIVRAHGGEITVQSALDEGSTFIVRLPLPRAEGASV